MKEVMLALIKPTIQAVLIHLLKSADYSQRQVDLGNAAKSFTPLFHKDLQRLAKYGILKTNLLGRTVYYKVNRGLVVQLLENVRKMEELLDEIEW